MEVKQKVLALLIGAALIVLSIQVTTAATADCPTCKVVYDDETANGPASAQGASGGREPLSFLDPSAGTFMSGSQLDVLGIVLKLL